MVRAKGNVVIIKVADVSALGERYSGVVRLTLTQETDGWTYSVDGMRDDRFFVGMAGQITGRRHPQTPGCLRSQRLEVDHPGV